MRDPLEMLATVMAAESLQESLDGLTTASQNLAQLANLINFCEFESDNPLAAVNPQQMQEAALRSLDATELLLQALTSNADVTEEDRNLIDLHYKDAFENIQELRDAITSAT